MGAFDRVFFNSWRVVPNGVRSAIRTNSRSDHLATRETAYYILFSAQNRIYKKNTHKVELKSLYFNLVYVFLFSGKNGIYKQNTHIQKEELLQIYFLRSISRKWKTIELTSCSFTHH